jgi:DNA topoisomerase VI subunit B
MLLLASLASRSSDLLHSPIVLKQSMYVIDVTKKEFNLIQEHELSKQEDAPMTLLVNPAVSSTTVPFQSRDSS